MSGGLAFVKDGEQYVIFGMFSYALPDKTQELPSTNNRDGVKTYVSLSGIICFDEDFLTKMGRLIGQQHLPGSSSYP